MWMRLFMVVLWKSENSCSRVSRFGIFWCILELILVGRRYGKAAAPGGASSFYHFVGGLLCYVYGVTSRSARQWR